MRFYLGTHMPSWFDKTDLPLFVSRRRLIGNTKRYKRESIWALDSGGFTELNMYGRWQTTPKEYIDDVFRLKENIKQLIWASPQDWMCEPFVLEKTGKTIEEHQNLTVENFLNLKQLAPELPFIPVLQGWELHDYIRCIDIYAKNGIDILQYPIVGIGTVCRRQGTLEAENIIKNLYNIGVRMHGFGFKITGLKRLKNFFVSSDSMSWSINGRKIHPCPFGKNKNCANCFHHAISWYEKIQEITNDQNSN